MNILLRLQPIQRSSYTYRQLLKQEMKKELFFDVVEYEQ
jgi:hypothetical protein